MSSYPVCVPDDVFYVAPGLRAGRFFMHFRAYPTLPVWCMMVL